MKDREHTPGPWKVDKWRTEGLFETVITDSRGHGLVKFTQRGESEKVKANAHLIAAAPELLETLEEVQEVVTRDKRFNVRDDFHIYNIIAQSIKKARSTVTK